LDDKKIRLKWAGHQERIGEINILLNLALKIRKKVTKIRGGADKSLARTGRKQARATEDFVVNISYL
jgi:hypothetical protein